MISNADRENNDYQIKQDLKLSVLTGPITFIIPLISYFFLYPIILSRSSLEVLGIWSLYVTTASFFTIADLGFSQHFIREAGNDRDKTTLESLKTELISANRFYVLLGLLGIVCVSILRNELFSSVGEIYSAAGLYYSAILLILSTTLMLISSLDAAILSARADNYYVKLVKSISPFFTYSFAIVGALLMIPIEGFAAGSLLSNLFLILIYRKRISAKHGKWQGLKIKLTVKQSRDTLLQLLKKGWQLYIVSIGLIIRQPVFRYVIALSLGLPAAGIFDIAMRITSASRDIVSAGFGSLFPSLAYFFRNNDREKILEIIRKSLIILIPIGFIINSVLLYNADLIFNLWLPDVPSQTISATGILAIWQLITIVNIPFWYLLQAAHQEKIAAFAIWAHTVFILIIIPVKLFQIEFSLYQLLIYWTVTALLTQFLIYISVEKKLKLFWIVFENSTLKKILLISLIYFCAQIFVQSILLEKFLSSELLNLCITLGYLIILFPLFLPVIKRYYKSDKSRL